MNPCPQGGGRNWCVRALPSNTLGPPRSPRWVIPRSGAQDHTERVSRRGARTIFDIPTVTAIGVAVAMVAACGSTANTGTSPTTTGPTPPPPVLSAAIGATVTGQPIDGITCDASAPQLVVHVHAHLAVYVDGAARAVPKNIGILPSVGGSPCAYWLHSHDDDGIMHVESPVVRSFTLGNYFDVWGLPLDSSHVGPANGAVIAYLNGQTFTGDVRSIPLTAHAVVQLDVAGSVSPAAYTFPAGD
jgi:hypothetical protein